ncbi:MAG: GGDEF domain-containing protein [Pseudomonadota bacterium]
MSEKRSIRENDRRSLLSALNITMEALPRDAEAALEALAGEILHLRKQNSNLRKQLEEKTDLADRDSLCPVFNRRAFMRELSREIASAERYQTALSLIYIDLDRFKLVNDRFGHATGDKVLKLVSTIILENIRQTDIPARLGGDEFAILLTHAENTHAQQKARLLEQDIKTLIVRDSQAASSETVSIGASCGTVTWKRGMTAQTMLDLADEKMFVAKAKSKRDEQPAR